MPDRIPAEAAARLFLDAQGLCADPARRATKREVAKTIDALGFVQVDTINVVARAHDLTLLSRLDGYRPKALETLLEADRALFEHWTHDAAIIPTRWYAHWKPRFARALARIETHPWWGERMGGRAEETMAHVLGRIREEGPLKSSDFEHEGERGTWWAWTPAKAALECLWRMGELAIAGREHFHKRYDLAGRVHPEAHGLPVPEPEAQLEWACASAAERLVVFTPRELAAFWDDAPLASARAWCEEALRQGRIVAAEAASADGSAPQAAFALPDWSGRLARIPEPPDRLRLLCPFDPILRDRARCLRRFGFDYRFEAFTPAAKRHYGYYVLPLLEGSRLVGRLDPKVHRDKGILEVRGLWWESGVRPTKARTRRLLDALERLAAFTGAAEIQFAPGIR
ncbi:MAG TPA: crosslink repair DNA glycosylase YcaQ family protein [Holophaga sp.]|nr:crosslink repair DNA glycosylase YcaQ family protein [Holophaga sp.]HPS66311.1 crosslink repair DNA glycosylase YcaQ family protein [Holophaga sp.]